FTILGLSLSRLVFSSRSYFAILCSPIFGISLFCLITTALMNHFNGLIAGRIGLCLTVSLSVFLYFLNYKKKPVIHLRKLSRHLSLSFIAGLIFLTPLFIAADYGIFALNGADFGSYAGWGLYFQDYTLQDKFPHVAPINFTQEAFINLQQELTRTDGAWRVGNVSFFAGLASLVPKNIWPTLYTVSIAFLISQFISSLQAFVRIILYQRIKNSFRIAFFSLFLNTIFWLAASHYTPNVFGLVLLLQIVTIVFIPKKFQLRLAFGLSFLLGTLCLMYPESFAFLPLLILTQLFVRNGTFLRSIKLSVLKGKTYTVALLFLVGGMLAYIWTAESFWRCMRHLVGILGYDRPGDYVGIDKWAYLSQGIGFVD